MMAEDEYQFLIGQTLVCLHLVLSADPHEVHEKTNRGEISAIDDCALSCFNPVSVTATMSIFFDVTYSKKGIVFGLIDLALIVAI